MQFDCVHVICDYILNLILFLRILLVLHKLTNRNHSVTDALYTIRKPISPITLLNPQRKDINFKFHRSICLTYTRDVRKDINDEKNKFMIEKDQLS